MQTVQPQEKPSKVIEQSGKKKKPENHKQRAYLNSITSILDYGGTQITGFIVSPFIVNGLGNMMYGAYQMLNQMTSYANMADTRASQVLKWSVSKKRDVADTEELRSEITTALVVTSIILPIILIVGGVVVWYSPVITQAQPEHYNMIRITASLMVSSLVIFKVFDIFESVLRGMNLGFKGMGIRTFIIVFGGGLKVLAITQGYGLVGLSAVQVLISLVTSYVFYRIVKKNVGWFGFGKTSKAKVISYTKISGWFIGFALTNLALFNSDKVLLGYLIDPGFVTIYVLTLFAIKAMEGVINAVVSGIIPGVGSFFGKKEFDKIKEARNIVLCMNWIFVTALGVVILLFNESFLFLWMGEEKFAGHLENLLLVMAAVQYIFFYMDSNFINVTLDMKTKVFLATLASAITIIMAIFLIEEYRILGLAISILVGRLVLSVGYPMILKRKMNERLTVFTRANLQPILVATTLFIVATYFSQNIFIDNWFALLGIGSLAFIGTAGLFWLIGLSGNDRKHIKGLLSKIKFLGFK